GSSTELTETGQFLGSLPWASPEQAEGHTRLLDVRADVYALGVMLYQLLTGEFPYRISGSLRQTVENITTADPTPPRALNPHVDSDLASITLKCLRKHPDDRYQTAGELARDLNRYLLGRPIEARRDSTWYLIRKTIRRHWLSTAAGGLALVAVLGVAIGFAAMYARETALRVDAQRAHVEAERQANIVRAVNRFLNEDLLIAAQPQERGRDVTVLEVVNAASQSLQGRFQKQPRIAAELHDTLGNTYMKLAKWHAAIQHAEQALALRRQAVGPMAEETLSSLNLVGRLYRRLGRLIEAEQVYDEMIPAAQHALGHEHDLTLKGMNNQAYVLYSRGQLQRAYEINQQVLEIRRRVLGPEDPQTLTSMNNHAYYAHALARDEEAHAQYQHVYEVRSRRLGRDHPNTLLSMHNMATMLEEAGRWEEAWRLQSQHLELVTRVQGAEHEHTMQAHSLLALLARRQERWADAEGHLQQAIHIQRQLGGEEHHMMAQHLDDLAALREDQGQDAAAEALYLEALELTQRTLGEDHVRSYRQQLNLGKFYLKRLETDAARPLILGAEQGLAAHYGPDHPATREAAAQRLRLEAMHSPQDTP
ncbi:MAG: tetratricopeptide repeat-containing protein kinase family protein, partial [Planctomycetota bacterium]